MRTQFGLPCRHWQTRHKQRRPFWQSNFFWERGTQWCEIVCSPKYIFPCQGCTCFPNGIECFITGSPKPPVRWSASVSTAPSATVRSVIHLAQMRCYGPKNVLVPCFLVSSLWENKMTATWRCFGRRKTSIPLTVIPYEILLLVFSRAPNSCSDFHRHLSAFGLPVTFSHDNFYSCIAP